MARGCARRYWDLRSTGAVTPCGSGDDEGPGGTSGAAVAGGAGAALGAALGVAAGLPGSALGGRYSGPLMPQPAHASAIAISATARSESRNIMRKS